MSDFCVDLVSIKLNTCLRLPEFFFEGVCSCHKVLNKITEAEILLLKHLNLSLLTGDELRKLAVLLDLSLKFGGEMLDGISELVDDQFFFVEKI